MVPRGSQEDARDTNSLQSDPTEASMGAIWLQKAPRGHPRHPRSGKVTQLRPGWVPPGSRRGSRETPKDLKNEPKRCLEDPLEKTMQNCIILMRKSRFSAQKPQKHLLFALPRKVIFGVFSENRQKHWRLAHFCPLKSVQKTPKPGLAMERKAHT